MKSRRGALMQGMGRNLAAAVLAAALIGAAVPLAADDGEIVWGGSVPLTGIYAQAGKLGIVGVEAYVAYLNASGGINGRPVRLVTYDSGSQPEQALAIFKRIMAEEENVVAFYGDSTAFSILSAPEVNERYKVLMGGSSLATVLADPQAYPYQVLTGPTYAQMVGILLEYIAEQGDEKGIIPRVALFHSNLEFGRDPIPAAKERAAQLGIEIVAEIETEPAGIDVAPEVLKLRRARPRLRHLPRLRDHHLAGSDGAGGAVRRGRHLHGHVLGDGAADHQATRAARRSLHGSVPLPLLLGAGGVRDPAVDGAGDRGRVPAHVCAAGMVFRDDPHRGDQAHAGAPARS